MNSSLSKVTVVIPVAEAHLSLLPRAVFSLVQQTYQPNILIVNDSIKPLTPPEIPNLRMIHTGGHKGSAYARNLGLDHVKTPLTFFLDADDYLASNALETLVNAYYTYDTCYVYSDWIQYGKGGYSEHHAKVYDRKRILRHSIHLVNILIATDNAKSVYYDINYRGWEDWEFHIRLGMKGFCGSRVPESLVVYDMTTSINREQHNAIEDEVYQEILDRYAPYLEGAKEFMACQTCGGGSARRIQNPIVSPPDPVDGMTTLEYLGQNTGPINFRVNNRQYRGANDEAFKFIQVPHEDSRELIERGMWRKVVKAAQPVTVPEPEVFNSWKEVNQLPVPESWEKLFKSDAEIIKHPSVANEVTEHFTPKKKGRPKGSKNRQKTTRDEIRAVLYEESAR